MSGGISTKRENAGQGSLPVCRRSPGPSGLGEGCSLGRKRLSRNFLGLAAPGRMAALSLGEGRSFGLEGCLGEFEEPDAELEPGPPNLDLFEERA